MTRKTKVNASISLSNKECKAIFEASELLDLDIAEFDVSAPGKITACIGSTVAKLKNFNFDIEEDVNEKFPLTLNEFIAVHYALSYTIDLLKDDESISESLDDSINNLEELSALLVKIESFLESCNVRFS